jgi:cysteine desulfurase/selenocysteine lyase
MFERKFPILKRKIHGHRLAYLDSASTTQKPREVIDAMSDYYENHNANIHRGIHTLSQEATAKYEGVRDKVKKFINATSREEIIFTSGATAALNLIAATWGEQNIKRGDEILLTEMEHHSNLVPWQIIARKKGAKLKFIPISEAYSLQLATLQRLVTSRTKIVALTHISNVLGTINELSEISQAAHRHGAIVVADGAQAGGHLPIDVQKLGADFYVLAGHKMYGPTGIGVLYGRRELLEKMPPYQTGGHMVRSVSWQAATWSDLPGKFEAGTANIAEVIGLGAAIDFLSSVGWGKIARHEQNLTSDALDKLQKIPGLKIYGPTRAQNRIGVISFTLRDVPPHDLASILDEQDIAIRTGHHCAMPLHTRLGIESSARVSFGLHNSKKDIDELIRGIQHARRIFQL